MDEVINYVMETPGNTNPNVLRGMLQNSSGGGTALAVEMEVDVEMGKATLNKTWKEIFDANCVQLFSIQNTEGSIYKFIIPLKTIGIYEQSDIQMYSVTCRFVEDTDDMVFTTDSEDGYPELDLSQQEQQGV